MVMINHVFIEAEISFPKKIVEILKSLIWSKWVSGHLPGLMVEVSDDFILPCSYTCQAVPN